MIATRNTDGTVVISGIGADTKRTSHRTPTQEVFRVMADSWTEQGEFGLPMQVARELWRSAKQYTSVNIH